MREAIVGVVAAAALLAASAVPAQDACPNCRDPYDSGGPLIREEAAYDVRFYDLTLEVEPADSSIEGTLAMASKAVVPADVIAFDLDTLLAIDSVVVRLGSERQHAPYRRAGGRVFVELGRTLQPGDELRLEVAYGGRPRVAPNPPWSGGFTWATTPAGAPWIATSNQTVGADVWWPNKDHVSDKPDSVALHITAPEALVVASNGRLRGVEKSDGKRTWHWFVSTPISAYNIALNIAPYRTIATELRSVAGDTFPVVFYVLPESYDRAMQQFPEFLSHLRWLEKTLGPYPFRADKYGIAQTPYLGMEHQTIIAYGADFQNGAMTGGIDWGFDALHHHELSHEWWGNLVTNADWKDMWLHEGLGTYMQALYLEETQGVEAYRKYLASMRPAIANRRPMAPRRSLSARQVYGGDIYYKGAWMLHTLRYLIGDEPFRELLRRFAYPDPTLEHTADGSAARFASSADFITLAEEVSGRDLGWFFEVYLRRAALPRLIVDGSETPSLEGEQPVLSLRWEAPDGLPFPMPVEVKLGARVERVTVPKGGVRLQIPPGVEPAIDPNGWLLREDTPHSGR